MAVTTWSFESDFEGWTFFDNSSSAFPGKNACPTCSDTRSHVSGAIQHTMVVSSLANVCGWGQHSSPTLNATIANGDTIEVDVSATSDSNNENRIITAFYTDTTSEETNISLSAANTTTLTLTQNKTLDFILFETVRCTSGTASGSTHSSDILEVRLTTATEFVGTGERPLELDVDLAGGDKIWATKWKNAGLFLTEHSSDLVLQNTFSIATGTTTSVIDITNRTFYISPYAPGFFGTANLDDIIYIFGRWDDGGVEHLAKSTDGGSTFSDIGDSATWLTGWVGAFFATDANILFAFVNGASRALYRSIDGGTTWTNLSTLPFDVDPGGMSGHPDGRILISNRDAGAQTAAYAEAPDYSSWIDATGSPSFPTTTPGAGSNAIIWIT
jgi:hypothetical protein